jgi:hypothetical protein
MTMNTVERHPWGTATLITVASLSVIWWIVAGQGSFKRVVLIASLSLAAFMVGALVGFLFSSHGEETGTIGKIGEWLLGIITTLTITKAATLKGAVAVFAAGPGPAEFSYAFGNAIFYAGLGFLFMFFQRELDLNVLLAKSRAERGKLEGVQQATQVIQQLQVRLPASLLAGVDYIDEVADQEEASRLKEELYKQDVETFLTQAEQAAQTGSLDWDIVVKTAYIYYYRTYFVKDEKESRAAVTKASQWIVRALNMNPLHADLTMKYADMLGALREYDTAVAVLEKLALRPEAPVLVKQWLGYYLRFNPERLDDAIRLSEEYHRIFPDETDSLFNIAYASAWKYCKELQASGQSENLTSENRRKAISNLRQALQDQPDMATKIQAEWIKKGAGPECLSRDKEFRALIGLPENTPIAPSASDKQSNKSDGPKVQIADEKQSGKSSETSGGQEGV